jgi:predicted nucleic acid-binding Zn ribbon protein
MEKAGTFLGRVARKLNRPEAAIAWLGTAWPTIVGKALAAHTRPLRCEGGYLIIVADGKPWQKQLEGLKREFCGRINQAWGGTLVHEVKFLAAKPGPKGVSRELDNDHTPFIRKRNSR